MPAPSWIVISDDLTGSCDAALEFVRGGITAEVLLDPSRSFADCGADVAVCSTESRNVPAPDAVELVRGAVKRRGGLTGSIVVKKIDSTIRGNIGAEVAELLEMSLNTPHVGCALDLGHRHRVHGVPRRADHAQVVQPPRRVQPVHAHDPLPPDGAGKRRARMRPAAAARACRPERVVRAERR